MGRALCGLISQQQQGRNMSKKSCPVGDEFEDDLDLYTSESKTPSYDTPRGMGLDLSNVECLDDEHPNVQETPILVSQISHS